MRLQGISSCLFEQLFELVSLVQLFATDQFPDLKFAEGLIEKFSIERLFLLNI